MISIARIIALVSCPLLALTGCGWFSSSGPQALMEDFTAKVSARDLQGAADLSDNPEATKASLEMAWRELKPSTLQATVLRVADQGSATAHATVAYNWKLDQDQAWNYETTVEVRGEADTWKIHWTPSALHPKLSPEQTLELAKIKPALAPVLDRDGEPLLAATPVISILLDRRQAGDLAGTAQSLAAALNPIDQAITEQTITQGATNTAEDQVYMVAALRDSDYQKVKPAIYDLPGVRFTTQTSLLAPARDFGTQILPPIRKTVEHDIAGSAGLRIFIVNNSGEEIENLYEKAPQEAQAVRTGLSRRIQTAAEAAVDPVSQPAMIVAVKPSTGDIIAVAQNSAADEQGALALTGQFPPGSTFKIITAAAALQSGKTTDSIVPCPGKTIIDGRRIIPNDKEFEKGDIPLHSAFGFSCNTTFAQLAAQMSPNELADTARQFGLGVDFEIPAITTITGSVPTSPDSVQRAENGFGQGEVLASPFGMAMAAATVAHGTRPIPLLINGKQTKINHGSDKPDSVILEPLRSMMREVVQSGTATQLAPLGDVYGKTGTAQFGDGTKSHGWFVGYQGDIAFAALVLEANSSMPAVEVTERFLKAVK